MVDGSVDSKNKPRQKENKTFYIFFYATDVLKYDSGTMNCTEMADHFLDSIQRIKYENVGLVFLG